MKISFVATVCNDADGMLPLLESLSIQTKPPDEIIIVDSDSVDKTAQIIQKYQKQSSIPIRLIKKKCTRGKGRNLAIEKARGEVITVSDAGCVLHQDWLETLVKPIVSRKADVVAGFYHMHQLTKLSYYTSPYLGTEPAKINKRTFIPSSRSLAFTKKAWKKVAGYPESYRYAAEDLVFAQKLKDQPTLKWKNEPTALVNWTPAHTWNKFFHDMTNHTKGNLESGYIRHLKKNSLVAIRYAFGIPFLLGSVISLNSVLLTTSCLILAIYLIYPAYKFRYLIRNPYDVIMFGVTQLVADLAVLTGLFTPLSHKA